MITMYTIEPYFKNLERQKWMYIAPCYFTLSMAALISWNNWAADTPVMFPFNHLQKIVPSADTLSVFMAVSIVCMLITFFVNSTYPHPKYEKNRVARIVKLIGGKIESYIALASGFVFSLYLASLYIPFFDGPSLAQALDYLFLGTVLVPMCRYLIFGFANWTTRLKPINSQPFSGV